VNVQEKILREKIDPCLTTEALDVVAGEALGRTVHTSGYRVLTGGRWSRVIAVATSEETLVFKISPKSGDTGLIREYKVLRYFADNTEMPVAFPYLVDTKEEHIPGTILVMSLIPGEVMHHLYSYLDPGARERIDGEIAEYVSDLHTQTAPGFGGVELPPADRIRQWPDFWIPRFDEVLGRVRKGDYISEKMLDEIEKVREQFPLILEIGDVGTLTHYDIWSGNVMIDTAHDPPVVSGFIDIPGYFADYAREISFMHVFGMAGEGFFDRYTRTHQLDEDFVLRLNAYSLRTHLQHITMYPTESFYRQGALNCLRGIQEAVR